MSVTKEETEKTNSVQCSYQKVNFDYSTEKKGEETLILEELFKELSVVTTIRMCPNQGPSAYVLSFSEIFSRFPFI